MTKHTEDRNHKLLHVIRTISLNCAKGMGQIVSGKVLAVLVMVMIVLPGHSLGIQDIYPHSGNLQSSLVGLEIEKVSLYVDTDHKYHQAIHDRVLARFKRQGLELGTSFPRNDGRVLLHLTVRSEPLVGQTPEKVLYYQKLEVFEHVFSERLPRIRSWAATWAYGIPDPVRLDNVSLERIEKDADELIDEFITDFLYANKKKKPEVTPNRELNK